jgi:transglutaminase-like putative cysteine protease
MRPHTITFHSRRALALVLIALSQYQLLATEKIPEERYKAATIPAGLLKNANAIIRWEKRLLSVKNEHRAVESVRQLVTVLNPEGRSYGEMEIYYDKFRHINDIDGTLFDANGEEIRTLEKSDVTDAEATSWYSLYEDNRVRRATLYHNSYPYTIEWEYEIELNGYTYWSPWYPEHTKSSVEYSMFEVDLHQDTTLRYWQSVSEEPIVTRTSGMTSYVWEAHSISPAELEPLGPLSGNQLRCVRVSPNQIDIDGFKGDFSSWRTLGSWAYSLYKNRQALPDKEREKALALTRNATSNSDKIRILYEYLQSKTRYVSIQLGIGGWQPFDATYVCEKGYGDCKALSNYMMSLLKAVNIASFPALIYSSSLPIGLSPTFPINQFNHVILCVPMQPDSIWLECTSQTIPFGHLSRETQNRYALLVTPEGGILVRTPTPQSTENSQIRKATVNMGQTGDAVADVRALFTGDQQDYVQNGLKDEPPLEREKWIKDYIEIPTYDLRNVDFGGVETTSDSINIAFQLALPHYASRAGKRLLFQPSLLEKRSSTPRSVEHRRHPVMISYPYLDVDTITYVLPNNYTVEALPKPVTIRKEYGSYESNITSSGGSLIFTRRLEISFTELPAEKYEDYRSFRRDIAQADKATAALVQRK